MPCCINVQWILCADGTIYNGSCATPGYRCERKGSLVREMDYGEKRYAWVSTGDDLN